MPLIRLGGMFNLAVFKRIVSVAALAGLLAGLLLTAVQQIQVRSIIQAAEEYETAAAPALPSRLPSAHSPASVEHGQHEHAHHEQVTWHPENGVERTLFTALANISLAIGLGLLLGAASSLHGEIAGWRSGLLWGLAGYMVFFVAPSLGLPPQVPGTEAAPLADRQLWWIFTAIMTACGLALAIFTKGWQVKILGVVLLGIPHLIGAPQPPVPASTAPIALTHAFLYATAIANAVFWLALGALSGFFYKKFP